MRSAGTGVTGFKRRRGIFTATGYGIIVHFDSDAYGVFLPFGKNRHTTVLSIKRNTGHSQEFKQHSVQKTVTNYAKQQKEVELEEGKMTEIKIIEVIKRVGYSATPHNE